MTDLDYRTVRAHTEALSAPLSPEDQCLQSMVEASPTKWHRAHTTWFFEQFILSPNVAKYSVFDSIFSYLFNSYYEAVGDRHPRGKRGLISRPSVNEVTKYRTWVDSAMEEYISTVASEDEAALLQLGLHHEQQHQELLLMDIAHALSFNYIKPLYAHSFGDGNDCSLLPVSEYQWLPVESGTFEIGANGTEFFFDNEGPAHAIFLNAFEIADRLVTCGEWLEFMDDGGYRRPELWMSDGWELLQRERWDAPLYWEQLEGMWWVKSLDRFGEVIPSEPVAHVSWYEADAFARWSGARLPYEGEWEIAAGSRGAGLNARNTDTQYFHASSKSATDEQWHGALWQWTESPYRPYPGFHPAAGAVGEYNGKFMVNQHVLRGSSFATPHGHARNTYRNFFPPNARWVFSGVRLARSIAR